MSNLTTAEQLSLSNLSQYNADHYDQTSNPYGFAGIGYQTLFPQALFDTATIAGAIDRLATQVSAQVTANSAIVAHRPRTSSTTSNTVASSGNVTFATPDNLITAQPFLVGDFVKAFNTSAPTTFVFGTATAVSANSITLALSASGGSGAVATWTIIGTGPQGAASGIASLSADTMPELGGNLTTGAYAITFDAAGSKLTFNSASSGIEMNGTTLKNASIINSLESRTTATGVSNNQTPDPIAGAYVHYVMAGALNILTPTATVPAGKVSVVIVDVTAPTGSAYAVTFDAAFNINGTVGGTVAAGTTTRFRLESNNKISDGSTFWTVTQNEAGRVLPA